MKDERKIINHHCEEVQELMGAVPNKLVRWGISAISLVLLVVFVCSCFFYYPETLTAGVTIIPLIAMERPKPAASWIHSLPPVLWYSSIKGFSSLNICLFW